MTTAGTGVKKTTRARKTAVTPPAEATPVAKPVSSSVKNLKVYEDSFMDLLRSINTAKEEFMALQREIDEVKESWSKEQRDHEVSVAERDQQEEIARKRETETYNYETALARKKAEDEFLEKKQKWERELEERKDKTSRRKVSSKIHQKNVSIIAF